MYLTSSIIPVLSSLKVFFLSLIHRIKIIIYNFLIFQFFFHVYFKFFWSKAFIFDFFFFGYILLEFLIVKIKFVDDLDIAPDFFEYFQATRPLLDVDKTLYCISAWNDNGKAYLIDRKQPELLYRSDFFPGLGWMMTK